jgi:DNA topoisomerase-1
MKTIETLKNKEKEIGARLSRAVQKARIQERKVGSCPSCGNGKLLMLRSKKTGKRFVGCTNYFEGICKTSYPIPQKGQIKPSRKNCLDCGCPTVRVMTKGKRVWNLCLDPQCPSKRKGEKVEV